jgi:hypothetical protein
MIELINVFQVKSALTAAAAATTTTTATTIYNERIHS